jgi:hypothetical protein
VEKLIRGIIQGLDGIVKYNPEKDSRRIDFKIWTQMDADWTDL